MLKFSALLITGMLVLASFSAQAEFNPFKKPKKYRFGNDAAWQFRQGVAIKSASRRDGSDTLYYHVRVSSDKLSLRLSKNDASGEIPNSRNLDGMAVLDVQLDGQVLPRFDWCLSNQQSPGNALKANAVVSNHSCVNPGNGDFFLNLDASNKQALKSARTLTFIVEPYGRPIQLDFSMAGFSQVMARVDQPPPPPPVVKSAPSKPARSQPVTRVEPKPKPKPQVKPKPRPQAKTKPRAPQKMCTAKPPAEFAKQIGALNYPCDDKAQRDKAVTSINKQVAAETRKQEETVLKKTQLAPTKKEKEWEAKQAAMWVRRCQKHWKTGVSPCYCEKYLDQAPSGVKNTCGR